MGSTDIQAIIPRLKPLLGVLIANFRKGDYVQRREAAIALSKFKGEKATDVLLQTYESDNIQDFMALALGNIENKRAVQLLINALNDPNSEVRFNAARALGMMNNDEAFNVLVESLNAYADMISTGGSQKQQNQVFFEEEAIISAISALGKLRNTLATPLLKRLLTLEKNGRIRSTIIIALGQMSSDRLLPIFQGALKDEDDRVRANAIEAIESIKSSAIVGILQPYLEDPSNRVRANVAKAIWKYGDYDVTDTLGRMLNEKDKWQRASAAFALGEIKAAKFIGKLALALKDEDPDVRRNAVNALKKIESPNALPHLEAIIDDPSPDVRVQAALAITRCNLQKAAEIFPQRLERETNEVVRATFISCLGETQNASFKDLLVQFLGDPDARVVANTIDALQKVSPTHPGGTIATKLKLLLLHEDNRVKGNAIRALWNWKDYSVLDKLAELLQSIDAKSRQSGTFVLGEIGHEVTQNSEVAEKINKIIAELVEERPEVPAPAPAPETPAPVELTIVDASPAPKPEAKKAQATTEGKAAQKSDKKPSAVDQPGASAPSRPESPTAPVPTTEPQEDEQCAIELQRAMHALNARELTEAEKIYQQILKKYPKNLKAIMGLADCYFASQQYEQAGEQYRLALQQKNDIVKAHYNLGTVYYFLKELNKAKEQLAIALKLYPKLLGAYLILAQIYQQNNQTRESVQLLSKAIELSPRNPILYQKLALLLLRTSQYEASIKVLDQAKNLAPGDVDTNLLLACAYQATRHSDEALACLNTALKTCSQAPDPYEGARLLLQGYQHYRALIEAPSQNPTEGQP